MASLAALAYAAAINGYQRALAGNGAIADAHLTQAARQSLTAASLIEALNGASKPLTGRSRCGRRARHGTPIIET